MDKLTKIIPTQGMWLYNFCLSSKPKATLEIGMAYGYSTLYFLAALARNQSGCHTAIDPFQHQHWRGIGFTHANAYAASAGSTFRFVEERSDRTATDLARTNSRFDLIFIDGNHRFDDVLTDFYLYAPLCEVGGHIIFDDLWMSSIQTAVAFVRANRSDFVEIPNQHENVSIFRKVAEDLRSWDHFQGFAVSARPTG